MSKISREQDLKTGGIVFKYAFTVSLFALAMAGFSGPSQAQETNKDLLGLPPLETPADNPITKKKVQLGSRIFNDKHFSSTGTVSCATCHDSKDGFATHLIKAKGVHDLEGTRNSPTVLNAAFNHTQFWDGRSPSLEDQAEHPLTNPIEMGLTNHEEVLKFIRGDKAYVDAFQNVFGVAADKINIHHVTMAIAAFERTLIDANSRFDQWYYANKQTLSPQEIRGFNVFLNNGRCVSCHSVEQTSSLFTDHKFHNIGVGINHVSEDEIFMLTKEYQRANYSNDVVDDRVLTDKNSSELGRFAVTRSLTDMGGFKTPTLRNIALTAPYMHDGSLKTLEDVVEHYNRGGASSDKEKINPWLSGGIRPLNLTKQEKADLVAFMKTLTSEKYIAKNSSEKHQGSKQ
jgi:cytochrome c peroxidase